MLYIFEIMKISRIKVIAHFLFSQYYLDYECNNSLHVLCFEYIKNKILEHL